MNTLVRTFGFAALICGVWNPASGGILINFDSLPAAGLVTGVSGSTLDNYLGTFGISITAQTAGAQVTVYDARQIYADIQPVIPSSQHNVIMQTGSNDPVSYTLTFAESQDYFRMTRPTIRSGVTGVALPAWSAFAFGDGGAILGAAGEGARSIFSDIPESTFNLSGPGIRSVQINSVNGHFAAFSSMMFDHFEISSVPSTAAVPEPASTALLGTASVIACGIARRRKLRCKDS